MLQRKIACDIDVFHLLIHGLENINIGEVEPEVIAISADLAQGFHTHQRSAVHGKCLVWEHSAEGWRYLAVMVEPPEFSRGYQQSARINVGNDRSNFPPFLQEMAVFQHARKKFNR